MPCLTVDKLERRNSRYRFDSANCCVQVLVEMNPVLDYVLEVNRIFFDPSNGVGVLRMRNKDAKPPVPRRLSPIIFVSNMFHPILGTLELEKERRFHFLFELLNAVSGRVAASRAHKEQERMDHLERLCMFFTGLPHIDGCCLAKVALRSIFEQRRQSLAPRNCICLLVGPGDDVALSDARRQSTWSSMAVGSLV